MKGIQIGMRKSDYPFIYMYIWFKRFHKETIGTRKSLAWWQNAKSMNINQFP